MNNQDNIFVAEVSQLIEENEDSYIDWDYILKLYPEFDQLIDKYPGITQGHEYEYEDPNYHWNLIRVLKDAYSINKKDFRLMVGYLAKIHLKIGDDDLNTYPWLKNITSGIIDDLNNDYMEKGYLKAFISYSTYEKDVATKIKGMFEDLGIESFMAHEDIGVSEKWNQRILKELKEANVFIPILSDNFKESSWCSQEAGIACFRDILVIPLSLDNVRPYGFMSHKQGILINKDNIPFKYLLKPIADNFPEINIMGKYIDNLIDDLKKSRNYNLAEFHMSRLKPYFDRLSNEQVNNIVDVSITNNQIWLADLCRKEYLPTFIEINKDKVDKIKLEKLLKMIGNTDKIDNCDQVLKEDITKKPKSLIDYINGGENSKVEFKSSIRWDVKNNKINKDLSKVISKAIAGFLNTDGGTLLIGVEDNGSIYGIENDINSLNRKDKDGFQQKVMQIVDNDLGTYSTTLFNVNFEEKDDKEVCIVQVKPSKEPLFMEYNNKETLFIRSGNTTRPIEGRDLADYIKNHDNFNNKD